MTQEHSILILHGPNLNMLGIRNPQIYGTTTLKEIEKLCLDHATHLGFQVSFYQSNSEGSLIDTIQQARDKYTGIIINAGALSHTSIALYDALEIAQLPTIEVHLSHVFKRESFRHHSYITAGCVGLICGFGAQGYLLALEAMSRLLSLSTP